MLKDIYENDINYIPHEDEFKLIKSRLTNEEYKSILDFIDNKIDEGDKEISVSSWLAGEWEDTPLYPIYEKACKHNFEFAGKVFGLFIWVVMMNREDVWIPHPDSKEIEMKGHKLTGILYFKPDKFKK